MSYSLPSSGNVQNYATTKHEQTTNKKGWNVMVYIKCNVSNGLLNVFNFVRLLFGYLVVISKYSSANHRIHL